MVRLASNGEHNVCWKEHATDAQKNQDVSQNMEVSKRHWAQKEHSPVIPFLCDFRTCTLNQ